MQSRDAPDISGGVSTAPDPPGFLDGLRVLELGDGVAGAAAGAILGSFGARVATVVDAGAPYRHGRPGIGDQAGEAERRHAHAGACQQIAAGEEFG